MPAKLPTYARFYEHSTLKGDPAPQLNNKPEYIDVLMAEISVKGAPNTSTSKRVFEDDGETFIRDRNGDTLPDLYPAAWNAFQKGSDEYAEGTPLKALPKMGVSAVRNLNTQGIMSVEDLAALDDSVVVGNPGMQELRKKAQSFLDFMEPEKAEAEKASREAEMNELREQIAALTAAQKSKPTGKRATK